MLKKSAIPAPSLLEEVVSVPELGGDVLVRGMLLKDRLEISIVDGYGRMSSMLAACVFADNEKGEPVPLYSAEEWERVGARHYAATLKLWDTTRRLSDIDGEEAEKNLPAPTLDSPAVLP